MPIINGKYKNPNWVNDAPPAIDAGELNAMSGTIERIDNNPNLDKDTSSGRWSIYQRVNTGTLEWTYDSDSAQYLCSQSFMYPDGVNPQKIRLMSRSSRNIGFSIDITNIIGYGYLDIEKNIDSNIDLYTHCYYYQKKIGENNSTCVYFDGYYPAVNLNDPQSDDILFQMKYRGEALAYGTFTLGLTQMKSPMESTSNNSYEMAITKIEMLDDRWVLHMRSIYRVDSVLKQPTLSFNFYWAYME